MVDGSGSGVDEKEEVGDASTVNEIMDGARSGRKGSEWHNMI